MFLPINSNHSTRYLSPRFWCYSLLIAGYEASLLTAPACCTSNVLFKPVDRIFFFRQRYGTVLLFGPDSLTSDPIYLLTADNCGGVLVFLLCGSFRLFVFSSVCLFFLSCSIPSTISSFPSLLRILYIFFHTCICIYTLNICAFTWYGQIRYCLSFQKFYLLQPENSNRSYFLHNLHVHLSLWASVRIHFNFTKCTIMPFNLSSLGFSRLLKVFKKERYRLKHLISYVHCTILDLKYRQVHGWRARPL